MSHDATVPHGPRPDDPQPLAADTPVSLEQVTIADLFAGAGGWAAGMQALGVDPGTTLGFEIDEHATATHHLAGFPCWNTDVAADDVLDTVAASARVSGLIASPPCQAFSMNGKGTGRDNIELLLDHVTRCSDGWIEPSRDLVADDVRADLTLQPLRWTDRLRPDWVACEQVPAALPMWEAVAGVLRGWGYDAWAGVLSAERYGSPQTRKRAFLLARNDGLPAVPPQPTNTAYDPDDALTLFGALPQWRAMSDTAVWDTGRSDPSRWVYVNGTHDHAATRPADRPAPTVMFGARANGVWWHHIDSNGTTVERVRVTAAEAAAFQGFPGWWPWTGPKTAVLRQIGNAVPAAVAAAVVGALLETDTSRTSDVSRGVAA